MALRTESDARGKRRQLAGGDPSTDLVKSAAAPSEMSDFSSFSCLEASSAPPHAVPLPSLLREGVGNVWYYSRSSVTDDQMSPRGSFI